MHLRSSPRHVWVGVDENGLGPRLGPLVATACSIETSRRNDAKRARDLRLGLDDSKAVAGFGAMAHAEGLVLAWVEKHRGRPPATADDVLEALSVEPLDDLRAPCPATTSPQCWTVLAVPAFGGDPARGHAILDGLEAGPAGVHVRRIRSTILCVRRYNDAVARRGSKLDVDLELFEQLLLDAREAAQREVRAVCGMVGGIRRYVPRFHRIDPKRARILEESSARAHYAIDGLGEVTFEVDADARSLPVAIASIAGKYLRELAMARQNLFYRRLDTSLPEVSGYHDPRTMRFVEASRVVRSLAGIDPVCFERRDRPAPRTARASLDRPG